MQIKRTHVILATLLLLVFAIPTGWLSYHMFRTRTPEEVRERVHQVLGDSQTLYAQRMRQYLNSGGEVLVSFRKDVAGHGYNPITRKFEFVVSQRDFFPLLGEVDKVAVLPMLYHEFDHHERIVRGDYPMMALHLKNERPLTEFNSEEMYKYGVEIFFFEQHGYAAECAGEFEVKTIRPLCKKLQEEELEFIRAVHEETGDDIVKLQEKLPSLVRGYEDAMRSALETKPKPPK